MVRAFQKKRRKLTANPTSVSFDKADTSTTFPKTVTVVSDDDTVTATSDQNWCKVKVENGKTVKIGAQANSSGQRTANVTIKDSQENVKVSVTQATGAEP